MAGIEWTAAARDRMTQARTEIKDALVRSFEEEHGAEKRYQTPDGLDDMKLSEDAHRYADGRMDEVGEDVELSAYGHAEKRAMRGDNSSVEPADVVWAMGAAGYPPDDEEE